MKEYFEEEEYLEDVYGDEIKVGDGYYRISENEFLHEHNLLTFLVDTIDMKRKER